MNASTTSLSAKIAKQMLTSDAERMHLKTWHFMLHAVRLPKTPVQKNAPAKCVPTAICSQQASRSVLLLVAAAVRARFLAIGLESITATGASL
jgi:hypothetical protein